MNTLTTTIIGKKLSENEVYSQLQMMWPKHLLNAPPIIQLPPGYKLRTYQQGDEPRFYEIMALVGWAGWNDEKLKPWLAKVLPNGWFMIVQAKSDKIVGTAMCLHNYKEMNPFQGELGWLAGDPKHGGKGLGMVASAAVTKRFIDAGYRNIRLYSEDYRLPALKTYLKVGYVPFLYETGMEQRWQVICEQLKWPFLPETWV